MKITSGVRAAKKEARWLGRAPFGYRSVRDAKDRMQIISSYKAAIVKKAYTLIARGKSQAEIRAVLKKEGVSFSRTTLPRTPAQPAVHWRNIGKSEGGGHYVNGIHEGIVSIELFGRVQDILQDRVISKGFVKVKSERPEFALRGLLLCGSCGSPMTGSASKGRNGYHSYYYCNHCREVRLRTAQVHERVEAIISEIKISKNANDLLKAMTIYLLAERLVSEVRPKAKIEEEITQYKQRVQNIEDDYADRNLDADIFNKSRLRYKTELEKLQKELKKSEGEQTTINAT